MSDLLLSTIQKAITAYSAGFRALRWPRRWGLVAGLLLLSATLRPASAQVVDDSTKNLYGARTTFIIREADVLRDQNEGRMIDTTLTRLPQARYWAHDTTYQQDLGIFGTASRRLLWEPNLQLGARFGRTVFDRYARNAATIPYYDTRSPYTFFRFHQGNPHEQIFELSYARSIKKLFNAGFAFERFGSNKHLAVSNTRTGQVEHTNFLFFVRYQTANDRYHALANFGTARHRAVEQGGVVVQAKDQEGEAGKINLQQLFDYQDEEVRLTRAVNRDDRNRFRLAHTYRLLGRGLTAFHVLDWSRQENTYTDDQLAQSAGSGFYPRNRLSTTATNDQAEYRQLENLVGVLGRTSAVEYRLYGRQRSYALDSKARLDLPLPQDSARFGESGTQLFVGGTAAFRYRQFAIETAGEYKLANEYWVRASARLGPLTGEVLSASYAPTLTEQRFNGNHFVWNTDFDNTQVQQARVVLSQRLGNQHVEASATVANITNLVYYNQQARPAQLGEAKQLFILHARHRFQLGHFFADNQVTYTAGGEGAGLRIPDIVGESRLYYQGYVFKKALLGQAGVQAYFQSRWRAYDYSPSTQQFFVQDHFTIRNLPVVDVFLSGDIKTVGIFLKMAYVNQFLPHRGYFATPYYPALPRRFQFGIRWQFFN
ncbi:putative porin [Hymenobacter weizhouensis]|uniref:putative porin n=1 Tax=Hymenobacter sp. YIM 151500-1 TaxID=2987689 RepID=UPI0022264428|nr:putative porin [Hymenobacter sp. YIM 151500-1]UYZ63953.1 putative porin [Hymenobacter sp. YIM 151500-1]